MKQGAAAGLAGGDGAPAAMGGGGWAWELRWGEVKPFPWSVGAEGGRRRGLHGGVAFGGGNGERRLWLAAFPVRWWVGWLPSGLERWSGW